MTQLQQGRPFTAGVRMLPNFRCLHDSLVPREGMAPAELDAAHVSMALLCFESTTPALTMRKSMPPGCSRATSSAAAWTRRGKADNVPG